MKRWIMILLFLVPVVVVADEDRWWPVQALPKALVRTTSQQDFPEPRIALQMMLQSVAGLAAKAVNEGRGQEMVWIYNGEGDLEKWYTRSLARHGEWQTPGVFGPWELVDRFAQQGVIKGYILYRRERSQGGNLRDRSGLNESVNVATSVAGLLDGIIIAEELENAAKAHGLTLLLDVREKTQSWCFETYKKQFNRRLLCTQDPRKPHSRDLAIAQQAFTVYGLAEPTPSALAWLEPLSPILGWNGGDEFVITDMSTGFGHLQTATDWCLNLPVLMAGTEQLVLPQAKSFDPRTIDWKDARSAVSFITTDGDNVQWLQGNFFGNDSYWGNARRGEIPFGWSGCFAQLTQVCPPALEYALETRTPNDWFIEWGGGYYYPDHFGRQRTNRWELLARQARRTWALMKRSNERVIGFNFSQLDTPETRKACEIFAGQTDGLLAMLAFQYSPYEGGAGKTFWVRDRNGIEVPVISARYSIWEHANQRPRAGTPAKIAREIRETIAATPTAQLPRYDWVIDHVWSYFQRAPGADENAEQLKSPAGQGGARGYSPVTWCAERLPANVRVVSPEELIWRIRMQHDPAGTRKVISDIP